MPTLKIEKIKILLTEGADYIVLTTNLRNPNPLSDSNTLESRIELPKNKAIEYIREVFNTEPDEIADVRVSHF